MSKEKERRIPANVRRAVLMEAGYRCAVPTCRTILAIDLHHLVPVSAKGPNTVANLIALCPTCHSLHHRGDIPDEAIRVYKGTLEALSHAFDQRTISLLLSLEKIIQPNMPFSTDAMLEFAPLLSAGLVFCNGRYSSGGDSAIYFHITDRGRRFIDAWTKGDRLALAEAIKLPMR